MTAFSHLTSMVSWEKEGLANKMDAIVSNKIDLVTGFMISSFNGYFRRLGQFIS